MNSVSAVLPEPIYLKMLLLQYRNINYIELLIFQRVPTAYSSEPLASS